MEIIEAVHWVVMVEVTGVLQMSRPWQGNPRRADPREPRQRVRELRPGLDCSVQVANNVGTGGVEF